MNAVAEFAYDQLARDLAELARVLGNADTSASLLENARALRAELDRYRDFHAAVADHAERKPIVPGGFSEGQLNAASAEWVPVRGQERLAERGEKCRLLASEVNYTGARHYVATVQAGTHWYRIDVKRLKRGGR